MVDICRLAEGGGLYLGDCDAVLQLLLVHRDLAVQIVDGDGTVGAATKDIVAFAHLCSELQLLSFLVEKVDQV